ncbi:MAG: M23 family metallopeptidase [Ornithinibacter sp.]
MSMHVILAVSLATTATVGARPLAAEDGQTLPLRASQSRAQPGGSAAPGSFAPLREGPSTPPAVSDTPAVGHPAWLWPLQPRPSIQREFAAPPTPYGPGHRGLDLVARTGAQVRAVAPGEVTHAGVVAGRGTVTVAHAGGISSTYEPVRATVREGEVVVAGELLGVQELRAGSSGHCGALSCLHLGARRGSVYLDPLPLLLGGRTVLLPLFGLPDQGSLGRH